MISPGSYNTGTQATRIYQDTIAATVERQTGP